VTDSGVEHLTIDITEGDAYHLVRVSGEVDTASSGLLESRLLAVVEAIDRDLGVDLSGITFIDSSGLRALVVTQQAVASRGRQVRLVGSTPMIDRLFEITGLAPLFPRS
jgi:anti-anti-sigma factor